MNSAKFNFHRRFRSTGKNPRPLGGVGANIAPIRARIIDGTRTKDGNLGLAFGGIRRRIVLAKFPACRHSSVDGRGKIVKEAKVATSSTKPLYRQIYGSEKTAMAR
jgi:hypothetical protein